MAGDGGTMAATFHNGEVQAQPDGQEWRREDAINAHTVSQCNDWNGCVVGSVLGTCEHVSRETMMNIHDSVQGCEERLVDGGGCIGLENKGRVLVENFTTPEKSNNAGMTAILVDIGEASHFGPPPGFEAQDTKRTWSGGKVLKAAWNLWANLSNFSAPGRIEKRAEIHGYDGLGPTEQQCHQLDHIVVHQNNDQMCGDVRGPRSAAMCSGGLDGLHHENKVATGIKPSEEKLREGDCARVENSEAQVYEVGLEKKNKKAELNGKHDVSRPKGCGPIAKTNQSIQDLESDCNTENTTAVKEDREGESNKADLQEEADAIESEALKSLTVAFALGMQPLDEDEFVDNFVEKRSVARNIQKHSTKSRVICTRSVTAKSRSSQ